MGYTINQLGPGAAEIIGLDCAHPLGDALFQKVRNLFLEFPVLIFRDQTLSAPKLAAFGRQFGALEGYASPPSSKPKTAALKQTDKRETPDQQLYLSPDDSDVLIMTNEVRKDCAPVAIIDNAETWHSDGSHKIQPYKAVILHAIRNPAAGGNTEFCDLRAVYDALPVGVQKALQGRTATHHWSKSRNPLFAAALDPAALIEGERIAAMIPEMTQPLVCAQAETGRPHLYLSPRFTIRIDDLPPRQSTAILDNLFAIMDDPQFVYSHAWREKDLMMWDNRCTNHRVRAYAADDIRCRHRVTVSSDVPLITFWEAQSS